MERNKLKRKKEVGINIRGEFHAPESQECRSILNSISILHNIIARHAIQQRRDFKLGPMSEKALIKAYLYSNHLNETQLNIVEMSLNDDIELAWKRQINKLYSKNI